VKNGGGLCQGSGHEHAKIGINSQDSILLWKREMFRAEEHYFMMRDAQSISDITACDNTMS
jgi:hypothetical protein